jgi:lysophospholipase L1-like esterase
MLYKLVALLTLPILIAQAIHLRKRALKLPEAAGDRTSVTDRVNRPSLSILIIGDSAAAGVGVSSQNEALLGQLVAQLQNDFTLSWQLVAKTGAKTQDLIPMLAQVNHGKPIDVVITSLGVNDVTSLQRSKSWLQAQQELHQFCFATLRAKHIVVSGMPPLHAFPLLPQPLKWVIGSRAKQFDRRQRKAIVNQPNTSYQALDFNLEVSAMAQDGFHPGALIYREWAIALSKRILSLEKVLM